MTSLSISVFILIITIVGYSAETLKCDRNEIIDDCPRNCSYDSCPKDRHHDELPCPKPTTCSPPACKCIFNHRRADNGTCIPTEKCPPFECSGPNEKFDPCPSYCPGDDCKNANPTGECPFLSLLVVTYAPSCRCIPHYWRKNGICVPYHECPEVMKNLTEGGNEESIENFYLKYVML